MVHDILNKYENNEKSVKFMNYSPDDILRLLTIIGNPHKKFRSIHIAGTNGKGSTAFMLAAVLHKAGYKTGLYTSPHLIEINERIKINSVNIDNDRLYKYISEIDRIITDNNDIHPTYFDILTAAAFMFFYDESVDIAVIETGLGGRLDSTNVITPEISIITDISFDHVNILGDTIIKITGEKCGIIKKNIPVITSNTDNQVIDIITTYCKNNNSDLYFLNNNFFINNIKRDGNYFLFDYCSNNYGLRGIKIALFPEHQVNNAATVVKALSVLKSNGYKFISDDIIREVFEKIYISGRFEKLRSLPYIIYDPAHNYNALKNLIDGLDFYYPDIPKLFIISLMKDKAETKTLELFDKRDTIYYLLNDPRAYIPEDDKFKLKLADENILIDNLKKSIINNPMIIFTGTFRLYSIAHRISKNI